MTVEENIAFTLKEASQTLQFLKDDFHLIGSAALILSGIKIDKINDLDILTSDRDSDYLQAAWGSRRINEGISTDVNRFSSKFASYKFPVFDIEIMGALHVNRNGIWERLQVTEDSIIVVGGFEIKIPTLREQKRILQLFNREKDLERIKLIDKLC